MTAHDKPWLNLYDEGQPAEITPEFTNVLDMFRASVLRAPDAPLIHYFDCTLTVADVDRMSDALAVAFLDAGVGRGDRLAVYLQNVPQYLIGMVAIWKIGAVMVPVNAMYRERELSILLEDSRAVGILCHDRQYPVVAAAARSCPHLSNVITTSELDLQTEPDPRLFAGVHRERHAGTMDMLELMEVNDNRRPPHLVLDVDSLAMLAYTSGTTGAPKGAMNSHGNMAFNTQVYREWLEMTPDDVMLGLAPLFHITGLVGHMALALLVPTPVVLGFRFDPEVYLELMERYGVTFAIGSITAFIALMNRGTAPLSALTKVYTGGQSVPLAVAEEFERRTGNRLRSAYGLTETTSPTHFSPLRRRSPPDPRSGAQSIGVPVFNTEASIVGEDGGELGPGEVGELRLRGPQLVRGYWEKPDETAHAFRDGWFFTGDVAFMDAKGWFHVVDRKKDMINVSGNKVWPREVEDVLYTHPAVLEAAVVGLPDAYRGEVVKAFVTLRQGSDADEDELREYCSVRMAPYKYPRSVEFLPELPKTPTGKILRRELRRRPEGGSPP